MINRTSSKGTNVRVEIDTAQLDKMIAEAQGGGQLRAAVQKSGFDVEKTAKCIVPVDEGRLANSIKTEQVKVMPGRVSTDIHPDTEYARYVEEGHVTSAGTYVFGHHYMTRALYQEGARLERALKTWVRTLGK